MLAMLLFCFTASASNIEKTYTFDADFDEGVAINVNHDISDQLQLAEDPEPFPFVNVAASNRGTMVRIHVETGEIIGEYWTSPSGRGKNPSRTTVDQFGNVWVANRNENTDGKGSVTRIGIVIGGTRCNFDGSANPTGQYLKPPFDYSTAIDRDGDGLIKTSYGLGNILSWANGGGVDNDGGVTTADDELIINFVRVLGAGTRTVAVDGNNDVWVGGTDNNWHEKLDGGTGQPVPGTAFNLGCGGYGGLVDGNGVLWSANIFLQQLLRYNTNTSSGNCIGVIGSYGIAIDTLGRIWNTNYYSGGVHVLDSNGNPVAYYQACGNGCRGVANTAIDNHMWIANSESSTVTRLDQNGNLIKCISVGNMPTGVAVDVNGKIWVTNYNSNNAMRIDPNGGGDGLGAVDLTVGLGSGAGPYNYSDMTGAVILNNLNGSWTVVYESECPETDWSDISWSDWVPAGATITAEARAADVVTDLPGLVWTAVGNGSPLSGIVGKFIEVQIRFQKSGADVDSPILYDLTIAGDPPGGWVNGTVTDIDSGELLMGVPIEVVDEFDQVVADVCTDEDGNYELEVPSGDFVVRIAQMPLGYLPDSPVSIEFTMDCEDVEVNFDLAQNCHDCMVKTAWFWRWQVFGALCDFGGLQYDGSELMDLLDKIHDHFDPFFDIYVDVDNLYDMFRVLAARRGSSCYSQAKAHFFAVLMNVAACRMNTYDIISQDGATASQAITYIAQLLTDGDPDNDRTALGLARAMTWDWVMFPPGYIPLDIPQIAYKGGDLANLPQLFEVSQNYPNPFNPATEISFGLPEAAQVSLTVYNTLGQTVTSIDLGQMAAGDHIVRWDGSGHASGVYFYRLKADNFVTTKKMVLMK